MVNATESLNHVPLRFFDDYRVYVRQGTLRSLGDLKLSD